MSEFEREDRYAVIKYKKLTDQQWTLVPSLLEKFDRARVDCVVVEKDWPEYNFVWLMLEHRMAGYPVPDFNAVKCAADVAVAQAELETANATIERLTADVETMRAKNNELNDTVERLKGGQGEPVAVITSVTSRKDLKFQIVILDNQKLHIGTKLYASQPAPVSVVLPSYRTASEYSLRVGKGAKAEYLANEWNACLDKVKELNQ